MTVPRDEKEWSRRYKAVSGRLALLKVLPASVERFKAACRCLAEGLSISMRSEFDGRMADRSWFADGIGILQDNPISNIPELAKSLGYDTPPQIRQDLAQYFQDVASMLYMWAEKASGTRPARKDDSFESAILFLFEVPCAAGKKETAPRVTLERQSAETYEDLLFLKRANGRYRPYHDSLFAILRGPRDGAKNTVSKAKLEKAQELLAGLCMEYNIGGAPCEAEAVVAEGRPTACGQTAPSRTGCSRSPNMGSEVGGVKIDENGNELHIKGERVFKFRGEKQWEVIDRLVNAWFDNFKKAEIGAKPDVARIFTSKDGKRLMNLVHFETYAENKEEGPGRNARYTGKAWFNFKPR